MTIPASVLPRVPNGRANTPKLEPGVKMKAVCRLMAFEGLDMAAAAEKAGSTTRAVRKAFESPSALNYLMKVRKIAIADGYASNPTRLKQLRDTGDNQAAMVAAAGKIEAMGEQFNTVPGRQTSPGLVINILAQDGSRQTLVSAAPPPSPVKPRLGRPPGDDGLGNVEPRVYTGPPDFSDVADPDDPPDAA